MRGMVVDAGLQALIHNQAPENDLLAGARAAGLCSMREDGQRLIDRGITSPEEVLRVTRE